MKFLKNNRFFAMLTLLFALSFTTVSTSSCARKIGCEAEHNVGPKVKRNGTLSMKRGKTTLYSKKQRKIRKKRRKGK